MEKTNYFHSSNLDLKYPVFEFKSGNIINSNCQALVNTVNLEGFMGKGVALDFKNKYPTLLDQYREALDHRDLTLYNPFWCKIDNQWIVNFPTKNLWRNASEYTYIHLGLLALKNQIKHYGITSIALPPLGCGNGGLDKYYVLNLIKTIMCDVPIYFALYNFENNYDDSFDSTIFQDGITICNHKTGKMGQYSFNVDRKTPLGNKYPKKHAGDRDRVYDLYEKDFKQKINSKKISYSELTLLKQIRNKYILYNKVELFCHCAPKRCHSETIRDFILKWSKQPLRTIVAGSRVIDNEELIFDVLDNLPWKIKTVICGLAKGPDTVGKKYGEQRNIEVEKFPADWDTYGKTAGMIRNNQMGKRANAAIIFWDGISSGTKNMIELAKKNNLLLIVITIQNK